MLKIGICSSIKVSNTTSSSYHSPSSSTVLVGNGGLSNQQNYYQNEGGSVNQISSPTDQQQGSQISSSASTSSASLMNGTSMNSSASGYMSNNILLLSSASSIASSETSIGSTLSIGAGTSQIGLQYNSLSSNLPPSHLTSNTIITTNYMMANQILFNCLCFHPRAPVLYAAIRNEIHFYDIITQSIFGKLFIDQNEIIKHIITLVGNNQTPTYLLVFTAVGIIYLFDPETHKLQTIVHQLKVDDNRPITCKVASHCKPAVYFSKVNSNDIVVADFVNKVSNQPFKLKGHKKPISALAHHPNRPFLASASTDGHLKLWDIRTNVVMPFSNLEEFPSYENSRNIEHSANYFLVFEPTGKYLVMTGSSGLTLVYGETSVTPSQEIIASGFICKGQNILSIVHHPQLPLLFVLSSNPAGYEEISTWEVNYHSKIVVPSSMIPPCIPDINDSLSYLSKSSKPLTVPKLNATSIIFHPTKNYLTLQLEASPNISASLSPLPPYINSQPFSSIRHINQNIYSINSYDYLNHSFPLVSKVNVPMGFFFEPEQTFNYPAEITFFDGTHVKSYLPLNGITRKLIEQPIIATSNEEICKPKKFLFNTEFQLFALIYDSFSLAAQAQLGKYLLMDLNGSVNQQGDGVDCVFLGNNQQILILGLDGKLAKVATLSKQGVSSFKNHNLLPKVTSVHSTPLFGNKVVLYFSQEKNCIYFSKNINQQHDPSTKDQYSVDVTGDQLLLQPNEKVFQVEWQSDPRSSQHVCAILTNQRILITNSRLKIINQISTPPEHSITSSLYFHSIIWLEWTLLYTTPTHLMYMTLQNNQPVRPISTLSQSPIILSTILPDRMLFGYQGPQVPGKNETSIRCQAIGILECLIMGLLSLPPFIQYEKKYLSTCLQNIVSKLDFNRISRIVLDKLREKSFTDLAYSLANEMKSSQSKQSSLDKFRMAWISKQYDDANRHLSSEFNRMNSLKTLNETEKRQFLKLKENMRDFGRECMNAGHYNLAKDCFSKLGEYIYLLQISILLNDKDSVYQIKKEAEQNNDQVLISACDKYLLKQKPGTNKVNPPVNKILPWEPTKTINVSVKVGLDYLSPINLNSIQRYYPISLQFSGAAPSLNNTRHKLRSPDEKWPPQDFKHSVALSPPRTLMSLVANRLSTKSHMSSTQTLRRSPSAENLIKSPKLDYKDVANQDFDFDSDVSEDDSDSGAAADVDSETEEDLLIVQKTIESQLKEIQIDDDQSQDISNNNIDSDLESTTSSKSLNNNSDNNSENNINNNNVSNNNSPTS
ncbi:hypothetical protein DICPUDRAFT_97791 [Dictyostelium purpureum]|uniref:Uncharacterized protein n=1 Tax=Dictyostelium purpureum TaxID=5786 RepID=F0ZJU5_DICPU|nr:uncharacterized protein DICPUDRAFT_97791 [Dictyostelium purpureum]EGC35786.1 hypothetical protein DICPUDRAFT_97791 [Dictyostelium purpureum]|eukprot:XP_003287680.1 hypothetical protein DICPUDRAFT_97791 [Dictyostelium purpureum]